MRHLLSACKWLTSASGPLCRLTGLFHERLSGLWARQPPASHGLSLLSLYNIQQRFSKWGPEASSHGITWNLLEKQTLGLSRRPAEPEVLGVPAAWQACFSSDMPGEI